MFIGFLQITQLFSYLCEFFAFFLFNSVYVSLYSSVLVYLFSLFILIVFVSREKWLNWLSFKKPLFVVFLFIVICICAEIVKLLHTNFILIQVMKQISVPNTHYITYSKIYYSIFYLISVLLVLVFFAKNRNKIEVNSASTRL